jgi:hypothetical protein
MAVKWYMPIIFIFSAISLIFGSSYLLINNYLIDPIFNPNKICGAGIFFKGKGINNLVDSIAFWIAFVVLVLPIFIINIFLKKQQEKLTLIKNNRFSNTQNDIK